MKLSRVLKQHKKQAKNGHKEAVTKLSNMTKLLRREAKQPQINVKWWQRQNDKLSAHLLSHNASMAVVYWKLQILATYWYIIILEYLNT